MFEGEEFLEMMSMDPFHESIHAHDLEVRVRIET